MERMIRWWPIVSTGLVSFMCFRGNLSLLSYAIDGHYLFMSILKYRQVILGAKRCFSSVAG